MNKKIHIKATKNKGLIDLLATSNDGVTINNTINPSELNNINDVAMLILQGMIREPREPITNVQGVIDIEYHTESGMDNGIPFDYYVIDNVTKTPLPTLLTKKIDELELLIDNISDINSVKLALKNVVQAVSFMKSFL